MDILVCGGAGYIGSFLSKMLVEQGHRVVVFDNLGMGFRSYIENPQIKFVEGNILNEKDLYLLFRQYKFDGVFHLALRSPYSIKSQNISYCYRNNLTGTMNLLGSMHGAGVHNIVFASSGYVYGSHDGKELDEKHPVSPDCAFATTNTTIESILIDYSHDHNLNSVSLRFHNAAGLADKYHDYRWDENDEPELVNLLNSFDHNQKINYKIMGDQHPTRDGTVVRDYIHVLDVCNAHIKAMEYLINDNEGAYQFNLGCDGGFSYKELINTAHEITGKSGNIVAVKTNKTPSIQTLANTRAKKELGWELQYSIEEIMQSYWKVMLQLDSTPAEIKPALSLYTKLEVEELKNSIQTLANRLKFWRHMELSTKIGG